MNSMNDRQIAAARALLKWSQQDLSDWSGVSIETVRRFERGDIHNPHPKTIEKFEKTFQQNGVEFIDGGVRRKKEKILIWEGKDAVVRLLDDVILTLKDLDPDKREVVIFGLDEEKFLKICPEDKLKDTIEQRNYYGIKQRYLLAEGDNNFVGSSRTYRWVPEQYFVSTPTYVYGTKVATLLWTDPVEIIIINNETFSTERRRSFNLMWDTALIPSSVTDRGQQ